MATDHLKTGVQLTTETSSLSTQLPQATNNVQRNVSIIHVYTKYKVDCNGIMFRHRDNLDIPCVKLTLKSVVRISSNIDPI